MHKGELEKKWSYPESVKSLSKFLILIKSVHSGENNFSSVKIIFCDYILGDVRLGHLFWKILESRFGHLFWKIGGGGILTRIIQVQILTINLSYKNFIRWCGSPITYYVHLLLVASGLTIEIRLHYV